MLALDTHPLQIWSLHRERHNPIKSSESSLGRKQIKSNETRAIQSACSTAHVPVSLSTDPCSVDEMIRVAVLFVVAFVARVSSLSVRYVYQRRTTVLRMRTLELVLKSVNLVNGSSTVFLGGRASLARVSPSYWLKAARMLRAYQNQDRLPLGQKIRIGSTRSNGNRLTFCPLTMPR